MVKVSKRKIGKNIIEIRVVKDNGVTFDLTIDDYSITLYPIGNKVEVHSNRYNENIKTLKVNRKP